MVLNDPPGISHPADIVYKFNTTGNQITWFMTDVSMTNATYVIMRDGIVCSMGNWNLTDPVRISVDGLNPAIYNYTIVVNDGLGGISWDTVSVRVINISAPPIREGSCAFGSLSMCIGAGLATVSMIGLLRKKKSHKKTRLV